jgi:hypothetical protein
MAQLVVRKDGDSFYAKFDSDHRPRRIEAKSGGALDLQLDGAGNLHASISTPDGLSVQATVPASATPAAPMSRGSATVPAAAAASLPLKIQATRCGVATSLSSIFIEVASTPGFPVAEYPAWPLVQIGPPPPGEHAAIIPVRRIIDSFQKQDLIEGAKVALEAGCNSTNLPIYPYACPALSAATLAVSPPAAPVVFNQCVGWLALFKLYCVADTAVMPGADGYLSQWKLNSLLERTADWLFQSDTHIWVRPYVAGEHGKHYTSDWVLVPKAGPYPVLTIKADSVPGVCDAPPPPPPPPPPCEYQYSDWSSCMPGGTRSRIILGQSPPGCVGTAGPLIETCNYSCGEPTCADKCLNALIACNATCTTNVAACVQACERTYFDCPGYSNPLTCTCQHTFPSFLRSN